MTTMLTTASTDANFAPETLQLRVGGVTVASLMSFMMPDYKGGILITAG
jgi:hypothetical protein